MECPHRLEVVYGARVGVGENVLSTKQVQAMCSYQQTLAAALNADGCAPQSVGQVAAQARSHTHF